MASELSPVLRGTRELEETEQRKAETAVSSSSFVAITASVHATLYFTFIYTFKLTEHAERA